MNTYGIHTFEVMIPHLTEQDYYTLRDKLKPISEYIKSEKYYLVRTQRDSGIRIRLYPNPNYSPYLKVIVNPWKLLNKVKKPMDNTNILLSGFDTAALHDCLCEQLRIYLGDEFGIDSFKLTRIDCTTDLTLDAPIYCGAYINLVRNSIWENPKCGERWENMYDDDNPETYLHFYRLCQDGYYKFTVYDKLYDLFRTKKIDKKSYKYGLLRFELSFEHRKINEVKKAQGTDDIMGLVKYYTEHSEELLKNFIKKRFYSGDYYSLGAVHEYLNNVSSGKMRNKLLTLLDGSEDMSRKELKKKMCRIFKTEWKIRAVKSALNELKINPVLIPCRYGFEKLPSLHKIFGIE
ncbi:MAG: hypothetical protein K2K57_08435 [Oscillospiraceae bacterium]|nr:hypothetical protein [Oscillospiraceae bacterium]